MDKRYHWRFWFSKAVGEELVTNKQVTRIEPGEFMRRCVLMHACIIEHVDMGRAVTAVDDEGERDILEILGEAVLGHQVRDAMPCYDEDAEVGFFIPEERAYSIEILAEKLGVDMDTFGMSSLLVGRLIVQHELRGGTILIHPHAGGEPIPFSITDDAHWSVQ